MNPYIRHIFQFIPASSASLGHIIKKERPPWHHLVIDLEDALLDVNNEAHTKSIKQKARLLILKCFENTSLVNNKTIGLRINSLHSGEFDNDLALLNSLKHRVTWGFVVIPKMERYGDLTIYEKSFKGLGLSFNEIIPVIETVAGLKACKRIFSNQLSLPLNRCFWGHHDYNLDAGYWPFPEQESETYWENTTRLINSLTINGVSFINGPIVVSQSTSFIRQVFHRTRKLCGKPFDQAVISFSQISLFNAACQPDEDTAPLNTVNEHTAYEIVKAFEQYNRSGLSFGYDAGQRLFISPQKYLCAKKYLSQNPII